SPVVDGAMVNPYGFCAPLTGSTVDPITTCFFKALSMEMFGDSASPNGESGALTALSPSGDMEEPALLQPLIARVATIEAATLRSAFEGLGNIAISYFDVNAMQ